MGKGILVGFLLHFCQIILFMAYGITASRVPSSALQNQVNFSVLYLPFLVGSTQLIYMFPAVILLCGGTARSRTES